MAESDGGMRRGEEEKDVREFRRRLEKVEGVFRRR